MAENFEDADEQDEGDEGEDFILVDISVVVRVTPEQVQAALAAFLEGNGDLGGFELKGLRSLTDGSVCVDAEAEVESGMSAMEWQSALDAGHFKVEIELPIVSAYKLKSDTS